MEVDGQLRYPPHSILNLLCPDHERESRILCPSYFSLSLLIPCFFFFKVTLFLVMYMYMCESGVYTSAVPLAARRGCTILKNQSYRLF